MTIEEQIIRKIKKNRISTTEVADCLGKMGVVKHAKSVNHGHFAVGKVRWVYAYNNSNWSVHEQVIDTQPGEVVFIEAFDCGDRAIIGELVSKYILFYREAEAIVCNTNFRDGNDIIKQNFPVWCKGFNPVGCFNVKQDIPLNEEILKEHKDKYDGSIAVCDDTGVVIIPKDYFTQEFLDKLDWIEEQEDIWFDCLDRKKWNTYEIVCLKKYKELGDE